MADTPSTDEPRGALAAALTSTYGGYSTSAAYHVWADVLLAQMAAAGVVAVPAAELESVRAERDALAGRVDMAAWDELTAERDGYMSEASDERERADRLAATIARVQRVAREALDNGTHIAEIELAHRFVAAMTPATGDPTPSVRQPAPDGAAGGDGS